MTIAFQANPFRVSYAAGADVARCQALRHQCFHGTDGIDADRFDATFQHLMVEDGQGALLATLRLQISDDPTAGYTAQFYDLAGFAAAPRPVMEIGRFCVAPAAQDAAVLRAVWGALTQTVDARRVQRIFGCASFAGVDPRRYGRAFAQLATRQGPDDQRPHRKASETAPLTGHGAGDAPLPALLRSYLALGGWVGDHAVIDRQLQTLHVFTCVDVAAVPPARARALRALADAGALA